MRFLHTMRFYVLFRFYLLGEWIEKRWTPLSRAIDRGLDAIVILFRDALNTSKNYAAASASSNQNRGLIGGPSMNGGPQGGKP